MKKSPHFVLLPLVFFTFYYQIKFLKGIDVLIKQSVLNI